MYNVSFFTWLFLVPLVLSQHCNKEDSSGCKPQDWQVGVDRVDGGGAVVHGHLNVPIHVGSDSKLDGTVHGSRVVGGPFDKHYSVGGGLNYQHDSGFVGGVDVTHTRGLGNTYGATVGVKHDVGPGTLYVGGGVRHAPGRRTEHNAGVTFSFPLRL